MREELRLARHELGNLRHLLFGELEVDDVEVLLHALGLDGLGHDHDAALDQPPENDLCDGLAVRITDPGQDRVGEQVVLTLSERRPPLELHTLGVQQLLVVDLLMERVRLHLIHRGHDFGEHHQVHETVGGEVGDTDRAEPAVLMGLFERTPLAVIVTERLVDQIQVEVVQAELPSSSTGNGNTSATLNPNDFTDAQAVAAIERITRGNFRLLKRLFPQIKRALAINELKSRHLPLRLTDVGGNSGRFLPI